MLKRESLSSGSQVVIVTSLVIVLVLGGIVGWGLFGIFGPVKARGASGAPVVPVGQVTSRNVLPENKPGEISILSDLSIFDLRSWRQVPEGKEFSEPISPANYTNHLQIIKRKKVSFLFAHYATGGLRIDLQCVTHPFKVFGHDFMDIHTREKEREYAAAIDISKEPVGKLFTVLIQATYWNSFQDKTESASTYTDALSPVPSELSLLVLYPTTKRPQNVELDSTVNDKPMWRKYANPMEAHRDPSGHYIYWRIGQKRPDHHYRLSWKW